MNFFILLGDSLEVKTESFLLFLFELLELIGTFHHLDKFARKWRDLGLVAGVKDKVDNPAVFALY